jgi:hypothetical protein
MSEDARTAAHLKWKLQSDPLLPSGIKSSRTEDETAAVSVFDVMLERYDVLGHRSEDMIVKHATHEVENDLRQHLTRSVLSDRHRIDVKMLILK